jgi:type VI protein secretion system component Hcp
VFAASHSATAQHYIGPSYLQIPGVSGGAKDKAHKGWVKAEGHYWTKKPARREIRGISGAISSLQFTGSRAPAKGANTLSLSIDKASPALREMMERCQSGAPLAQVTFSESSELARHPQEHGPRPASVPEYYRYVLKNVRLTCPVVAAAPEQAFGLSFDDIEWVNAQPQPNAVPITAEPAKLPPAPLPGASKVFVISWFAPIADSRPDQCPKMNPKPSQDEYYALMSPGRAAEQRAFLADKGGANTTFLPYRGPDEMNVILLPGIVPDPGFLEPQVEVVRGFDLDGDDGSGPAPARTRKHRNFVSPDGRRGIDNQLFVIQGCIEGWRRNGFLPMIGNELRRAGGLSILVEVSGIDNERNDNEVTVSLYYSTDPIRRDGTSKIILPDFTYRVSSETEFTQDFARFRGKIINGVVTTDPIDKVFLHEGPASTWPMMSARMRIEFLPNGGMSAVLGGYRDWRQYLANAFFQASDYENTIGFKAPGMYNAVRRAADGLKNPATGEFEGISTAYEMEGIPAFIPPAQNRQLLAGRSYQTVAEK